jgi:hypothetical protein
MVSGHVVAGIDRTYVRTYVRATCSVNCVLLFTPRGILWRERENGRVGEGTPHQDLVTYVFDSILFCISDQ